MEIIGDFQYINYAYNTKEIKKLKKFSFFGLHSKKIDYYMDKINKIWRFSMSNKCSGNTHSQSQCDHHANQHNPNNSAYVAAMNNHSNQCNPNHNGGKQK